MNLLIDLGNSRSKWGLEEGGSLRSTDCLVNADLGRLSELLGSDLRPERILISSVLGAAKNTEMTRLLAGAGLPGPDYVTVEKQRDGLTVAYSDTSKLGVDRWLAMLAAWTDFRSGCVVVDAGSALTVDVIDEQGQHQGGFIVPGLAMMQQSLFSRTEAVKVPQLRIPKQWSLGKDTFECVENGVSALFKGMLGEVLEKTGAHKRLIFTGGDGQIMRDLYAGNAEVRPNLVLDGLICLL